MAELDIHSRLPKHAIQRQVEVGDVTFFSPNINIINLDDLKGIRYIFAQMDQNKPRIPCSSNQITFPFWEGVFWVPSLSQSFLVRKQRTIGGSENPNLHLTANTANTRHQLWVDVGSLRPLKTCPISTCTPRSLHLESEKCHASTSLILPPFCWSYVSGSGRCWPGEVAKDTAEWGDLPVFWVFCQRQQQFLQQTREALASQVTSRITTSSEALIKWKTCTNSSNPFNLFKATWNARTSSKVLRVLKSRLNKICCFWWTIATWNDYQTPATIVFALLCMLNHSWITPVTTSNNGPRCF